MPSFKLLVPAAVALSSILVNPIAADIIYDKSFGPATGTEFLDPVSVNNVAKYVELQGSNDGLDYVLVKSTVYDPLPDAYHHGKPGGSVNSNMYINALWPVNLVEWGADDTHITYLKLTTAEGGSVQVGKRPQHPGSASAPNESYRFAGFNGYETPDKVYQLEVVWVS